MTELGDKTTLDDELAMAVELRRRGTGDEPQERDQPQAPTHSWQPVDLTALDDNPHPPPSMGGIVYPGRRHLLSGLPESLKSLLALVLAAGELEAGRSVLWCDFEMGAQLVRQTLTALGVSDEAIRDRFLYLHPDEPIATPKAPNTAALEDVQALVATAAPSLVVVDAYAGALAVHGCDPNSESDIERFNRIVVAPLLARGAAILLIDHVVKDKDARSDSFSTGSQRKLGLVDVHLRLEIVHTFGRGLRGLARIVVKKDRPAHLARPRCAEFALSSDAETGRITAAINPLEHQEATAARVEFRPTTLMEKASRHLEVLGAPASQNAVVKAKLGKAEWVRVALDVLVGEGYASVELGPRGAKLYRSLKSYREADDATSSRLRPDLVPDEVEPLRPTSSPPYRGGTWDEVEVDEVREADLVPTDEELDRLAEEARRMLDGG